MISALSLLLLGQVTTWGISGQCLQYISTGTGMSPTWGPCLLSDAGVQSLSLISRRSLGWNSTSVLGDVCQYLDTSQDLVNETVGTQPYFVRSSSAHDIADGGGAQSVRVVFLNDAGTQLTRTIEMGGTTASDAGTGIAHIQWIEVERLGNLETGVGNITLSPLAGTGTPTTAQTIEYIAAGGNRSMCGHYQVPAGKTAYLLGWSSTGTGNGTFDVRLRAQSFADDDTLSQAYHFKGAHFVSGTVMASDPLYYLKIPSGADIKCSAIPTAAPLANRLDCEVKLLLVPN